MIVPAYNESGNISAFVKEWYPVICKADAHGSSRLVVIDDGSLDGTYDMLLELAKDRPYLVPVLKEHSGHGPTLMHGYEYALENGAEYIFQTDSDRQTDPDEFVYFTEGYENCSAIFGVRANREDGFVRKAGGAMVRKLIKHYTKALVPDANAPYRLMSRELLKECLPLIDRNSAVPNILITSLAVSRNKKVFFRPVTFRKRSEGRASLNMAGLLRLAASAKKELKAVF